MKINTVRRWLYLAGRVLGDVNAVRRGTIGKRLARRLLGRLAGKTLRGLVK